MPGFVPVKYNQQPKAPTSADSAYKTYQGAATQQGGDYDDIMNRYRGFLTDIGNSRNQLNSSGTNTTGGAIVPTYQTSADYTDAIKNLGDLSKSGGYSAQNIADIRERGISPIRSVYANAQENLKRQRALQGGYSPNYTAVSAKMARELSSQLADQATSVNAQIAQNVAQNKIATAPNYANTALSEQNSRNDYALKAADLARQFGVQNLERITMPLQMEGSALGGMTNLFGTTPGFANMAGNQAANLAQIQAGVQAQNQNNALRTIGAYQ